ncbi:MAG: hypothetical protein ACR2N5_03385, partial [Solirubrobacterales bacterium]
MKRTLGILAGVTATGLIAFAAPAAGADGQDRGDRAETAKKGKKTTLRVCRRGCEYRKIQKAVNDVKKGKNTTIKIEPGKYKEGVVVSGHKYDKLTIEGTKKNPKKVKLQGKNAKVKVPGQPKAVAQNGIEGLNVSKLKIRNLTTKNYATNGVFIHADPNNKCKGFQMKNLYAADNRSYGLFARNCSGGSITKSDASGHGDSGIYIGETPFQNKPKWTKIKDVKSYENVLGYSGTNSKYVDIVDSYWYNNGIGLAPNTLDSELFQPTANGKIRKNHIFWNNFNYFLPDSPVQTVSGGLGEIGGATIQFPTGVGVFLFGSDGWQVKNNDIFGNFMWGVTAASDPFNAKAVNQNNQITDNKMGRGGSDENRVDFWNDGSGTANCFDGNSAGSTYGIPASSSKGALYPTCPGSGTGSGTNSGNGEQFGELAGYVTSDPPCTQEDKWA